MRDVELLNQIYYNAYFLVRFCFGVFLNKKKTLQFANTLGKCISVDRGSEDQKQNFLFLICMKQHSHEGLSVEIPKALPGSTSPPFIKKSNEHHKKTPKIILLKKIVILLLSIVQYLFLFYQIT